MKTYSPKYEHHRTECLKALDEWRTLVKEIKPRTVVLAGRWTVAIEPTGDYDINRGLSIEFLGSIDDTSTSYDEAKNAFREHLAKTIDAIRNQVWPNNDPYQDITEVPAKWHDASAVILYQSYTRAYSKKGKTISRAIQPIKGKFAKGLQSRIILNFNPLAK